MRFIQIEFINGRTLQIPICDEDAEEQFNSLWRVGKFCASGETYFFHTEQILYAVLSDVKPEPKPPIKCDFCSNNSIGSFEDPSKGTLHYCMEHAYYSIPEEEDIVGIDSLSMKT